MKVKVRHFSLDDLKQILEIEKGSFPKAPWSDAALLEWYTYEPEGFLVAEKEERVVGYIICSRSGYVVSIAVRKEERKEGIGKLLINEVINNLKITHLNLHCRIGNESSIKFFEILGFRKSKIIKNHYEDEEDAVEMER